MPLDNNKDGKPDAGMVVIWAKDFDASSYASMAKRIAIRSPVIQLKINHLHLWWLQVNRFCERVGNGQLRKSGLARTYILIQDNNKACTGGVQATTANINGLIKTGWKVTGRKCKCIIRWKQCNTFYYKIRWGICIL